MEQLSKMRDVFGYEWRLICFHYPCCCTLHLPLFSIYRYAALTDISTSECTKNKKHAKLCEWYDVFQLYDNCLKAFYDKSIVIIHVDKSWSSSFPKMASGEEYWNSFLLSIWSHAWSQSLSHIIEWQWCSCKAADYTPSTIRWMASSSYQTQHQTHTQKKSWVRGRCYSVREDLQQLMQFSSILPQRGSQSG